jgi:hypothetical protein
MAKAFRAKSLGRCMRLAFAGMCRKAEAAANATSLSIEGGV